MSAGLPRVDLRRVTADDVALLRDWDDQPHVTAADPNDDWAWETEAGRDAAWREQLIAQVDGRPVGFMEILDPARDPQRYWGDIDANLRAIDIWIGAASDLGRGYGSQMMSQAVERCFADPQVHGIVLDPLTSNTRAHRFYERLGFAFVELRRFGPDECRVYRLDRAVATKAGPARIGVDGCRRGWFYVRADGQRLSCGVTPSLAYLVAGLGPADRAFVDIPIGLREDSGAPRACDTVARKRLGRPRAASVFPAPLRTVLDAPDYATANARSRAACGKGLSRQAFQITPKIKEVDDLLAANPALHGIVREVHPELCFWSLAGRRAMTHRKKTAAGFEERLEVLSRMLPGAGKLARSALARFARKDVARDDIADALVALVTAQSPANALRTVPATPERDARALPMEMVYRAPARAGRLGGREDCEGPPTMKTAAEALSALREGNRRFVSGETLSGGRPPDHRLSELADGQAPFAIVLGCSDSRVPAEIVFDQGLGDLFVIRVAGNVVAPSQIGSVEFAAAQFGTRLVVVLGHTRCGAVSATLDELERPSAARSPNLAAIVDRIRPAVEPLWELAGGDKEAVAHRAVRANVRAAADRLRHGSSLLETLCRDDGLLIVGAEYALETGEVTFFDGVPGDG